MWVRFKGEIPAWFGPAKIDGAEWVEGATHDLLVSHRRVDGKWLPREPVAPEPPSPEQIEAERQAAYEAALSAREAAIDDAIKASDVFRQFLRGEITLTAYRDAASRIAATFPMPER